MSDRFRVACVQTNSGTNIAGNLQMMQTMIREAAGQEADFVLLPEMVSLLQQGSKGLFAEVQTEEQDIVLPALRKLVVELDIWLHCGSFPIKLNDTQIANRSYVLRPDGTLAGQYDKIHMFDVDLPGGESYRESKNYHPGTHASCVDLPWGKLGMSICYDLRFPHLYRTLAKEGADFLCVPAAFTHVTGKAHWHVLLRARAIETGCYVFAPAQTGQHEDGRRTYGHALIIDPWGEVLADAGEEPGIITAEIDVSKVAEARQRIPALTHDRAFIL